MTRARDLVDAFTQLTALAPDAVALGGLAGSKTAIDALVADATPLGALADIQATLSSVATAAPTYATQTFANTAATNAANAVAATVQFTKAYESTEQTITAGGLLTLAHGMGVAPKVIELSFICKTADAGYAVGEIVRAVTVGGVDQNASARGMGVRADATDIKIRFGTVSTPICLLNASGSSSATITIANWRLLVRAYA